VNVSHSAVNRISQSSAMCKQFPRSYRGKIKRQGNENHPS
jgi:hypothetical protein